MKERSLFGNPPEQRTLSLDHAGEARRRVELAQARAGECAELVDGAVTLAKDAAATSPNDARIAQAVLTLRAAGIALANAARMLDDARRDADGSSRNAVMVDRDRETNEIAP